MIEFGCSRMPHLPTMLADRLPPLARKMALARLRRFLEPELAQAEVNWHAASPILQEITSSTELQGAIDDPKAFMVMMNKRTDQIGQKWVVMQLRLNLEPKFAEMGLKWVDVVPVLERLPKKELRVAAEDPVTFLDTLAKKAKNEGAKYLAIAYLRISLEPLLPKGLPWADVVPALLAVETSKEIYKTLETPDLILWKMSNVKEWPAAKKYSYIKLRPTLEPKLKEGVCWEDFIKVLQVLEVHEQLPEAVATLDHFLKLLDMYPMDASGKWWFISQLRPLLTESLILQGNSWPEAVELMSQMDAAFDLKPALRDSSDLIKKLANGTEKLAAFLNT